MIDELRNLITNKPWKDIYIAGILDTDEKVIEFIPDTYVLYFQFGERFLEVKQPTYELILGLEIVDDIIYSFGIEDGYDPCCSRIADIIFKENTSLQLPTIKRMYFYGMRTKSSALYFDALHIKCSSGQDIFVEPFLGINVGGLDVKEIWLNNRKQGIVPEVTIVDFD